MSVQAAMDFLAYVRRHRLNEFDAAIDPYTDQLQLIVQVAQQNGFTFTGDDLRAAFRHDWQHRWLSLAPPSKDA